MKTISSANLDGKRVFVRCGFNVPMKDGKILDDSRIRSALPTIQYCMRHARQIILCSHLGRPEGAEQKYSLLPIAHKLQELLRVPVALSKDLSVNESERIVLLENIRFFPGEKKNDPEFAKQLASLADVFILEAFADMHRADASITGIASHIPAYAGLHVQREVTMLERVLKPHHPFVAILGFAKIADKLALLEQMLEKVDRVLIGGAVIFTFYKAAKLEVGNSLVEEEMIPTVEKILRKYGHKLQLPTDVVVSSSPNDPNFEIVPYTKIPADKMGLDIGPVSTQAFCDTLDKAKTIFWNGPVGLYESPPFDQGTLKIAQKLASLHATTIIGGGDTAAAVQKTGFSSKMSHVSTGGGATLTFLSGKRMPGLEVVGYYGKD